MQRAATVIARSVLDKDTSALAHAQLGSCAAGKSAKHHPWGLGLGGEKGRKKWGIGEATMCVCFAGVCAGARGRAEPGPASPEGPGGVHSVVLAEARAAPRRRTVVPLLEISKASVCVCGGGECPALSRGESAGQPRKWRTIGGGARDREMKTETEREDFLSGCLVGMAGACCSGP